MSSKQLFEAFSYIDDWYLDIADAPAKENMIMNQKRFSARRMVVYVVAAAICVSLLAVTAVAAGWIPGLFYTLKEIYPQDEKLFDAAAQANEDAVPEIIQIPQLDLSQFVLLEQYFDGNTILIGYDVNIDLPEPAVGIEPGNDLLNQIRNGTRMTEISWSNEESWHAEPDTENAIKYCFPEDGMEMDRMLKATLSEKAYQKAWEFMQQQGYVCIAVRDAWIGDHLLINGVDTIEAYLESNAYADRTEYTSDLGHCIRLEPLPEDIRTQEQITVTLNVKSYVSYWYMDLSGEGRIYPDNSNIMTDPISFKVDRVR